MLLAALFLIALIVLIVAVARNGEGTWTAPAAFIALGVMAFAAILFCIMIVSTYTNQVNDNAQIRKFDRVGLIKARKAKVISGELKTYLTQNYPQYEQSTIAKIVDSDPRLILLRFPELKTATTFIAYTKRYDSLKSDVFKAQLDRQTVLAREKARQDNWLVNFPPFLP